MWAQPSEPVTFKTHKDKNSDGGLATWEHGFEKSRQARSEGATCSHPSRASARTKDDVCDDDKVAVMPTPVEGAPTCESLTLKRVEINAVKTETEHEELMNSRRPAVGFSRHTAWHGV